MSIPAIEPLELVGNSKLRQMSIEISDRPEDQEYILYIIRNKLYSNKLLAILREYSTNGLDAHVEAGIPNVPIEVTLPTYMEPELKIRDFGLGLTPDEIDRIFTKYGRSSKRESNTSVGQMGIGSKSAFCYGENFMVVSSKDGIKTTYNLTLNGLCTELCVEPMMPDEKTGIEIIIPILNSDIRDIALEAKKFFQYWKLLPEFKNMDESYLQQMIKVRNEKPLLSGDDFQIINNYNSYCDTEGVAIMGNVPYPINWNIISNKISKNTNDRSVLFKFIKVNRVVCHFEIGELDFAASREALEYTERTCNTIVARLEKIMESIFNIFDAKISSTANLWEAKCIWSSIFNNTDERMFKGDMYALGQHFSGKFKWNGIEINSGNFTRIDRWDFNLGYSETTDFVYPVGHSCAGHSVHSSQLEPICISFTYNNDRTKKDKEVDKIVASKNSVILIHDLDKPSLKLSAVRYIFNETDAHKVYFLKFKDDAQKQHFFTTLNFETVPVIYISSIEQKVKDWLSSNRSPNSSGGRSSHPRTLTYIDLDNPDNGYHYENVRPHDLEGFYFEMDAWENIKMNNQTYSNPTTVARHCANLIEHLKLNIKRIYCFKESTTKTKWFQEAIEDSQWVKFQDCIANHKDRLPKVDIQSSVNYENMIEIVRTSKSIIGPEMIDKVMPLLTNKNGAMYQGCKMVMDSNDKSNHTLHKLLEFFNLLDSSNETIISIDFNGQIDKINNTYKLLNHVNNMYQFRGGYMDHDAFKEVIDYINYIDNKPVNEISTH